MLSDINLRQIKETPSGSQRERIHPHKFTLWVAIGSILMMFAGLTSAYIVKSNQENWVDVAIPKAFWFSTATLLLSSVAMQMALRSFKQKHRQQYRHMLGLTVILGMAFVVLQYVGFASLWNSGVKLRGAGAGQFLYIIAGLHAVHVIGGVIALLVIFLKLLFGKTKSYNPVPVEVVTTYWHFVDLLWLYLLIFFSWVG